MKGKKGNINAVSGPRVSNCMNRKCNKALNSRTGSTLIKLSDGSYVDLDIVLCGNCCVSAGVMFELTNKAKAQ